MKDTQILSTFQESAPPTAEPALGRVLIFDACHVGVVLRAVLFAQAVVAVAAIFTASSAMGWSPKHSLPTGGAFPATLLLFIVASHL